MRLLKRLGDTVSSVQSKGEPGPYPQRKEKAVVPISSDIPDGLGEREPLLEKIRGKRGRKNVDAIPRPPQSRSGVTNFL